MKSRFLAAAVLSLATILGASSFALAAPARVDTQAQVHEGKDAKFPMAGDAFKAKVDAHMTKARAKMEERASKLDADKATQVRARFDARVAAVNDEVAKAIADGTVTKEEAKAVHHAMRPNGKHARGQKRAKNGTK